MYRALLAATTKDELALRHTCAWSPPPLPAALEDDHHNRCSRGWRSRWALAQIHLTRAIPPLLVVVEPPQPRSAGNEGSHALAGHHRGESEGGIIAGGLCLLPSLRRPPPLPCRRA
ncbi:hypothetical protein PR202_ga08025 [Eleusine coracana subsp. coracana]|uniref:Uncharacterized protein n=1 Tax=Eleusine coracana subsp. coracana TaxID=191504 RepID=A0AAV5C250_ELECO|nr:hypothetical protein PR202_ga08025 [Eleusine coracana subsp. coracana]